MKRSQSLKKLQIVVCVIFLVVISACGQTPTAIPTTIPTSTLAPANTSTPIPTSTNTPEPTPIPGIQVYPVSSLENSIPWLPLDEGVRPMSVYYGFNVNKPPFDNVLVRQAFAAAINKDQIAEEAAHFKFRDVSPATSLTHPQVLARDLYGEVGILFDPAKAKEYLQEAGYSSVESFPPTTLIVSTRGETAPGAYFRMAESIVSMWETHLGIKVIIEVSAGGYDLERLQTDPPEIYQLGWGADYNDPDNFLKALFYSGSEFNFGHFSNQEFDNLVDKAASISDPIERQLLYIQAEKILTEQEAGVIPLFHTLYYQQP